MRPDSLALFFFTYSHQLTDYFEVYEGLMTGRHMEVRIDFRDCSDPTGSGLDFTGTIAGAYLRDMYLDSPESMYHLVLQLSRTQGDKMGVKWK